MSSASTVQAAPSAAGPAPASPGRGTSSASSSSSSSSSAASSSAAPAAPAVPQPTAADTSAAAAATTAAAGGSGEEKSASELGEYISNRSFPRCRQSRTVPYSVLCHNLPSLRDAPISQRSVLLRKKLRLCSYTFDFSEEPEDAAQDTRDKDLKRSTLLDLINFLSLVKPSFTDEQLAEIFEMLSRNLFRPLPPNPAERRLPYIPEEDDKVGDPAWLHLQVVYEFLLRLATATETDTKLLDRYFSQSFVLGLLELFDSEDPRERDYLKTILHRIYGNFMSLRPFIRRSINNIFYRLIYETDRHNGVAELLEILGSIINGFALPLKDQHKQFLARVLLPLHKVTRIDGFHAQLSYCITQFVEKDPTLAPGILNALLRFWPQVAHKKEVMLLSEVEEVIHRVEPRFMGSAQTPLFAQLARCINSPHFQVSERAVYLLSSDVMVRVISAHCRELIPLLADALLSNTFLINGGPLPGSGLSCGADDDVHSTWVPGASTQPHGHWNPTIVELTADILKALSEVDGDALRGAKDRFDAFVLTEAARKSLHRRRWARIDSQAASAADAAKESAAAAAAARTEAAQAVCRPIVTVPAVAVASAAAAAAAGEGAAAVNVTSGAQLAATAAAAGAPLSYGYKRLY